MRYILIILTLWVLLSSCQNTTGKEERHAAVMDEQTLKNFVLSIPTTSVERLTQKLDSLLVDVRGDSNRFYKTVSYLEKPLGDPNSSLRNETLYMRVLQEKLKSTFTDSSSKNKARERLYLLMQNRVGGAANDFTYYTASGGRRTLNAIKARYTLLYFYNPECDACKQMKTALLASEVITRAVSSGDLKVLAIYTDRNEKIWINHLADMPSPWIHGRDENEYLYKNKVYDLRAIPTLYLLDAQKKVLLKDVLDLRQVEAVIGS